MFTASILPLLLAAAPDTYTLQWKLKEGDVFYNKASIEVEQKIQAMGEEIDQTITMKMVVKFKVKSAKQGATVVEMTYLDMKVDAAGLPGANIGDKLKDVTFTATLDDKMKVTKLEGYDKFLDTLADGDDAKKKLMKTMMPESTVRQMFSQTFVIGPGKPVAVGDKWDQNDKMALGPLGNAEIKAAMKLESVKGDVATISVKGDLTFKAGDGDTGLPIKFTKVDLKADKFNATHTFDLKVGRVTETKVDMEMSGSMTLEAAGMKIDATIKQKTKVVGTITEKNPVVD